MLAQRLFDVSWYMRTLNEHLARRANAEDECTGRFSAGRFKSQALLDEAGLLTAMAYVDLNPIRAGTPEESTFISLYARIEALQAPKTHAPRSHQPVAVPLLPFRGVDSSIAPAIPFTQHDYLTLLDWTGWAVRSDKRSAIDSDFPPILRRLNIDAAAARVAMRPRAMSSAGHSGNSIIRDCMPRRLVSPGFAAFAPLSDCIAPVKADLRGKPLVPHCVPHSLTRL